MDILIDGKYAVELPSLNNGTAASVRESDVMPANGGDLKSLPFSGKRILAIGESVHGTGTMNDMGVEIIKTGSNTENAGSSVGNTPDLIFHINRYWRGTSGSSRTASLPILTRSYFLLHPSCLLCGGSKNTTGIWKKR